MSISPDDVALTEEQKLYVARIATETGQPWEQVLHDALTAYRAKVDSTWVEGGESFYDAAVRLGLIGCVPGGPPDLSTNPKYMEGFGTRAS